MAYLEINGVQYEAKASFKFERKANERYVDPNQEYSGLEKIYQDLMSYKISALLAFWDCATSHLKKEQPSVESIEDTLVSLIEEDEEELEKLFKEAFQVIDNSGFFKLQLREFWKNLDMIDKLAKDEEEKEQALLAKEMFLDKRKELNPSR
ncbi:tail assembly chaperone [Cytobacillus horneckiae]|uniref:tail assembly chaperone n=1 Tax=Cytobacillus horneckiae TaxID=549687 RepID=UPI00399F131A